MDKETFTTLMGEVENHMLAADFKEVLTIRCEYAHWVGGQGLLGCLNQAMADYLSQIITGIQVDDKTFKAWRRGEKGELTRTSFYTPVLNNLPAGKTFIDQLVGQNKLPRTYVIHSFQEVRSKD